MSKGACGWAFAPIGCVIAASALDGSRGSAGYLAHAAPTRASRGRLSKHARDGVAPNVLDRSFEAHMVCHVPEGELRVKQSDGMEFVAKKGDVWTCKKGIGEDLENVGSTVAIMRIVDLLPE